MSDSVHSIPHGLLDRVAANAAGIAPRDGLEAEVERLRARPQSTVLEYRFDGGPRLIAKRFAQREGALVAYEIQRVLWDQGFGPGSRHRVAEPLGCFPEWGVLLMRGAAGHRLSTLAAQPGPWEQGIRAAARWLAQLHASSVDLGPREDITQDVFRLGSRAARAGASHPELEGVVVSLIEELAERVRSVGGSRSRVQTHGRYHARHVFVAPESVTVIDLDRVALADPGKDLGEFLHRLRLQAMRARLGDEAAELATLAFLEEYAAHAHALPGGLLYYWSYSILSTLLRLLELDHEKWERRLEFFRAEFADVPRRTNALRGVP